LALFLLVDGGEPIMYLGLFAILGKMPFKTYQKYIVAAVPLVLVAFLIFYFSDIFTYIILAWVVSMIGAPINQRLQGIIGKNAAAITTLVSFTLILGLLFYLFIPPIVQQTQKFGSIDYNQLAKSFEEPLDDWNTWLIEKGILPSIEETIPVEVTEDGHVEEQIARVDSAYTTVNGQNITLIVNVHNDQEETLNELDVVQTDDFFERAKKNIIQFFNPSRITGLFSSIVGFLGNLLITVLSVLFIAFFFLKENGLFTQGVRSIVPNTYEEESVHVIDQSAELLIRYFVGVAIQVTIITIFITTVLSFLGFENALLIGFFAALMNVVPYIGPILGAAFAVIIVVSANLDVSFYDVLLPKILKILGVFAVMQLIDNFLLQPNIFSKSVKAHPLEIFIVVLMGAKIGGVTGMILAIPGYTVIRVLAKVFLSEFKVVQRITKGL